MTELAGFSPSWAAEFPNDNPALHEGASWVCLAVCGPARPVTRPRAPLAYAVTEPVIDAEPVEPPTMEALAVEAPATMEVVAPERLILAFELADSEPAADVYTEHTDPLELEALDVPSRRNVKLDAVFEFDSGDPSTTESPATTAESEPAAVDPFAAYVAAVVDVAESSGNSRAAAALPMLLEGTSFDASALPDDARERLVAASVLVRSGAAVSPSNSFTETAGAWRGVLRGTTSDLAACGESTLDTFSAELLKALGVGQGSATDVRRELRRRGVAAFGMLLAA